MGFIYYFVLLPIILCVSYVINQIFGLVMFLVVLREYHFLYKYKNMSFLFRMSSSDSEWLKQYAEAKKSTDDYLDLTKKHSAEVEKRYQQFKEKGLK